MRGMARAGLAAIGLALVLAALVAWVVPGFLRRQAVDGVEAATGRRLAIGALSLHPFTWKLEIEGVSLSEPGGKGTFATFRRGTVVVSPASVWRGAPIISQVRIESPHFNAIRTGPSTYNFSDLIKYLTMPIPAVSLNDVAITGGTVDFLDRARPEEERHTVRDAELLIPFLTTIPALASQYGNPRFSALIDGAPLVIESQVRGLPKAPEVSAKVNLTNLSLPGYLSYFPAKAPVQVDSGKVSIQGIASYRVTEEAGPEVGWDGALAITEIKLSDHPGPFRVDVSDFTIRSRFTLGKKRGMRLEEGAVEVHGLSVPFGERDGMTLALLSVTGARFDGNSNRLDVAGVLLADGRIRISRDRRGVFSPIPLLEHLQAKLPRGRPTPGEPVQYRVKKVEGKGLDLAFTDGTRKELPSFSLSDVGFQATDVVGPLAGPVAFSVSARFGKKATIRAAGVLVPTPLAGDVELELKGIALADGGPYLPEGLGLTIAEGRLDLKLAATLATRRDRLTGSYGGSASVRSLKLLDPRRQKLLAWESLTLEGVKGSLAPPSLRVGRVELSGLRADLVAEKDGTLNLPRMPGKGAADPVLERLQIDELVVKNGGVDFTDRSVPGDYHAEVREIVARVTGISSEAGKVADVQAQALLPGGAPLRVRGKVALLRKQAFADLELTLDKLDLSAATPYAGAYLGLEVDEGTLTVKSRAKVEQGRLAAENRIRVDQLTFGESVKSDRATILPVQLIVDILRDGNGDIVLDLPVTASTDDQDLAGTVVKQAVMGVLFPPGSPLRDIEFSGCSADLTPDAQGRLLNLAAALQERPAMKVFAVGYVDQGDDGKACRALDAVAKASAGKGAVPPLEGDARMSQLAEERAGAVRNFLVTQGNVDPTRVFARIGDVHGAPKQGGDRRARVEFARATD
jgi:hypothetical protein